MSSNSIDEFFQDLGYYFATVIMGIIVFTFIACILCLFVAPVGLIIALGLYLGEDFGAFAYPVMLLAIPTMSFIGNFIRTKKNGE